MQAAGYLRMQGAGELKLEAHKIGLSLISPIKPLISL